MLGTHNEEFLLFHDAAQEVISRRQLGPEFRYSKNIRIDLARKRLLRPSQRGDNVPEGYIPKNHQISVTIGSFFLARD
jgi:hypothetical protein